MFRYPIHGPNRNVPTRDPALGRSIPVSPLVPSSNESPNLSNDMRGPRPHTPVCAASLSPEKICTCALELLPQAYLQLKDLVSDDIHGLLDENGSVSDEIIRDIVENCNPPLQYSPTEPPTDPSPQAPSNGSQNDHIILLKGAFEAHQHRVNEEVKGLRENSLKCVLADPRADGKSSEICREEADKQVQRQFDDTEKVWKAKSPTRLFSDKPETGEEVNGVDQSGRPPPKASFEDATRSQLGCLTTVMLHQMSTSEEARQLDETTLSIHVNRSAMQKQLEILRQWNVKWQKRAEDRERQTYRAWACGPRRHCLTTAQQIIDEAEEAIEEAENHRDETEDSMDEAEDSIDWTSGSNRGSADSPPPLEEAQLPRGGAKR